MGRPARLYPPLKERARRSIQMSMSDLRLPVRRLSVILVLADGHRQEAALFLADGQDAADLLASPEPFVPAHTAGRIRLYARAALAAIAVPPAPAPGDDDGLPWERRRVM